MAKDYDIREALGSMNKADLIELIIEYADNGFYPHELFLLKADYPFSATALREMWESAHDKAHRMEDEQDSNAADYLAFCADGIYKHALKLDDAEKLEICRMLGEDLTRAAEEDGIGMYGDSEWVYGDVKETIAAEIGE